MRGNRGLNNQYLPPGLARNAPVRYNFELYDADEDRYVYLDAPTAPLPGEILQGRNTRPPPPPRGRGGYNQQGNFNRGRGGGNRGNRGGRNNYNVNNQDIQATGTELSLRDKDHQKHNQRQRGKRGGRGGNNNQGNNGYHDKPRVMINFNNDEELYGYLQKALLDAHTEQIIRDSGHTIIALFKRMSSFENLKRNKCLLYVSKIYSKDSIIYDTNLKRKTYNFDTILNKSETFIPVISQFLMMQVVMLDSTGINDIANMLKSILLANVGYYQKIKPIFDQIEMFMNQNQALKDLWNFKEEIINQETRKSTEIYPNIKVIFTLPNAREISNHYSTPWNDFNNYKQVLFNMEQENYLIPFRKGIEELRNGKLDYRDLYLYEDVKVVSYLDYDFDKFQDSSMFLSFQIRSPPKGRRVPQINFNTSDRLTNRSLLILSKDPNCMTIDVLCKSCSLAHSQDIDTKKIHINLLNQGIVPVIKVFGDFEDTTTYFMFESTSSWSATQPVLNAIDLMMQPTFPPVFIDPILKLDYKNSKTEPDLLVNESVLLKRNINDRSMVPCDGAWQLDSLSDRNKDIHLKVDHEQYSALKHSIPYDLTLVNGAPGTGKTHFARELLRVLVTKEEIEPIVVITFTNHALDSFLEGVVKSEENPNGFILEDEFTRFGGPCRTTNKTILARRFKMYDGKRSPSRTMKYELKIVKKCVQTLYSYLGLVNFYQRSVMQSKTLEHDVLVSFMRGLDIIHNGDVYNFIQRYHIFERKEDYDAYQKFYNKPPKEVGSIPYVPNDFPTLLKFWNDRESFMVARQNYYQTLQRCKESTRRRYQNRFQDLRDQAGEEEEEDKNSENGEQDQQVDAPIQQHDPNEANAQPNSQQQTQDQQQEPPNEEEEDDNHVNVDGDLVAIIESGFITDNNEEDDDDHRDATFDTFMNETEQKLLGILRSDEKKSVELLLFTKDVRPKIIGLIKSLEETIAEKSKSITDQEEAEIGFRFAQLKLIGLTSTVASVHKKSLEFCKCKTIIIEEAGELTESMTSCILPQTLKHLVLIGDYNQLRPKVEHKLTFEPYHYDISLFEKLVQHAKTHNRHGRELYTLSVQRRMHPQISELLRRTFYKTGDERLTDCDTMNWGIPKGIPYRVRFIFHNHNEDPASGRSHKNIYEAKVAASLFVLFTSRGYKPEEITIVVLYKGQMYEIKEQITALQNKLRKESEKMDPFYGQKAKYIPVKVLDNFQGEENKVIIISLTRSSGLGFVKNRNRALVTLSRAKEMMVVIGHESVFGPKTTDPMWKDICTEAQKLNPYCVSNADKPGFAVFSCPVHSETNQLNNVKYLQEPEDIIKYRFNFCNHICNHTLDCGHKCKLPCHVIKLPPTEDDHLYYVCPERCVKRCPNNHQCTNVCGKCKKDGKCPHCHVKVPHLFPCGHTADIECYKDTGEPGPCPCKCGKLVNGCAHRCDLICGHRGECDCKVYLETNCPTCHERIKYKCRTEPFCQKKCKHILECGHRCQGKCGECTKNNHHHICQAPCDFVYPCGCKCQFKCSDTYEQKEHEHYLCKNCPPPAKARYECSVCGNVSKKNVKRCECRCNLLCSKCQSECHALSEERCAFFCPHQIPADQCPGDETVFCFHDNHFMKLDEAKAKILEQYKLIIGSVEGQIRPIAPLRCPIEGCNHKLEPSWLFKDKNKVIRILMKKIKILKMVKINNRNDDTPIHKRKIWWFRCNCNTVFCHEVNGNDIISCPNCQKIYELVK